jgi:hypothetical protein
VNATKDIICAGPEGKTAETTRRNMTSAIGEAAR